MPTDALAHEPFTLGNVPADIWLCWIALSAAMLGYWLWRARTVCVLTFDVFFIALYLYLPIVFMSLFAFSPLNATVATDEWHWRYLPKIHEAFYVSLFGAAVFLASAYVAARSAAPPPGLTLVARSLRDFWSTRAGLTLLLSLVGMLGIGVIATVGVASARENSQAHTEFRPLAHLFSTFAVLGMYITLIEGYRRGSTKLTATGVVLAILMLGFGTRKVTVGTLLYYGAIRLINSRSRKIMLPLACSALGLVALIVAALGVEAWRSGEFNTEVIRVAPQRLLFGNNLSELRDFAWMLSAWDQEPLLGKTYVSGALAWIPSYLLPERKLWSWGIFSTHMTGLDVGNHTGLRPTLFAEAYFNFDLVGVLLYAVFLGVIFGRLSAFSQHVLSWRQPKERVFALLCAFLYFEFFLRCQQSANCYQSYIDLLLLVAGLAGTIAMSWYRDVAQRAAEPTIVA
jgi:oligosaccharide repeat unit polymerase